MALFDRSMTTLQELPVSRPAAEEAKELETPAPAWGSVRKILFRFCFSYFGLYLVKYFLQVLASIPFAEPVAGKYEEIWSALVPWVARHLFHSEAPVRFTGSGDSIFGWVQIVCYLVLAVAATLIWTLLDRKRSNYARLFEGLKVYVRFGLGLIMIEYGGLKIVPSQFPQPSLDRLMQPFGDASPMGLLWTFMGASPAYTIFAGLCEWSGGVLLLFRRTALLGALLSLCALTNVVMLNYCYDVPVKLLSSHLLVMAVFLVAPELRRLADLFLLNRPVVPASDPQLVRRPWLRRGAVAFQLLLAIGFSFYMIHSAREQLDTYYSGRSPLRGAWNVDELQVDGLAGPSPGSESLQWKRLIFDYLGTIAVQLTSDSRRRYVLKLDEGRKTLALTRRDDPAWKSTLSYQRPAADQLRIEGTFDGRKIRASLHRIETPKFLLVTRGFHWVNEVPFNR